MGDQKDIVVGIDLGTTNSVVAVTDDAGTRVLLGPNDSPLIPSVVSFHPNGDVLVGGDAKTRRLQDAKNTVYSVKRLIGRPFSSFEVKQARRRLPFEIVQGPSGGAQVEVRGETYNLSEISAFVLRMVRRVAETKLKTECDRAVITVPANFNELQRTSTRAAGRIAGLNVLRIINEPTAAALAYGFGKGNKERIAIFDLGGGTFDITILQLSGDVFEVLATAGDSFLGGDDIDVAIADEMIDAFLEEHRYDLRSDPQAYECVYSAAEMAKCQLSTQEEITVQLPDLVYGEGGVALSLKHHMTRTHLEKLAQSLITRTFDVCEEAMRLAGVRPTQLDNVILVGGSTRIPLLQRMVAEYFGKDPLMDINPDLVVAQGAAIQARTLAGARQRQPLAKVRLKKMSQEMPAASKPVDVKEEQSSAQVEDDTIDLERPSLPEGELGAPDIDLPEFDPEGEAAPAALLLDVTPFSLGVETVDGYCEHLIPRNSPIPTHERKYFSTARDNQQRVEIRICQGEYRRIEENQSLGMVALEDLRAAPRGEIKIEVNFMIDADGTLNVKAIDRATGQAQSARIELIGAIDEKEIDKLKIKHKEKFDS